MLPGNLRVQRSAAGVHTSSAERVRPLLRQHVDAHGRSDHHLNATPML